MNKPKIHVLIVEDDTVDRMACRRSFLQGAQDYELVLDEAETAREGLQKVQAQEPDCVLLDYQLPDLNGLEFLVELRNVMGNLSVPVIMLTGADNTAVAVEAMKRGAQDYLVKDPHHQYLELLPTVIQRVLRERQSLKEKEQMESRLAQAEARYRILVEQIPAITYTAALDTPGKLLYVSPQLSTLGYAPEEWVAHIGALRSYIHPDDRASALEAFDTVRATGGPLRCEYRLFNRDGEVRWFLDEASVVHDESGSPLLLQGILIDITKDKLVEEELRLHRRRIEDLVALRTQQFEKQAAVLNSANANLAARLDACTQAGSALKKSADQSADLVQNAPCAYHLLDAAGVLIQINDTGLAWLGRSREEVLGKPFTELLTPASTKTFQTSYRHLQEAGSISGLDLEIVGENGVRLNVVLNANLTKDAGCRVVMLDKGDHPGNA